MTHLITRVSRSYRGNKIVIFCNAGIFVILVLTIYLSPKNYKRHDHKKKLLIVGRPDLKDPVLKCTPRSTTTHAEGKFTTKVYNDRISFKTVPVVF